MGSNCFVQAPEGSHPTPTCATTLPVLPDGLTCSPDRYRQVLAKLRSAIQDLPNGKEAKPDTVIAHARVQRSLARKVLRFLQSRKEYAGFSR